MKRPSYFLLLLYITAFLLLSACGSSGAGDPAEATDTPAVTTPAPQPEETAEPSPTIPSDPLPTASPESSPSPEPTQEPSGTDDPLPTEPVSDPSAPLTSEEITELFAQAMRSFTSEITLDVSGMSWTYGAENDLRNIYYSVLSQSPELKYTYDLEVTLQGDDALCRFLYMPYKTGAYADGPAPGSHTIDSLHTADVMAQSMIGGTQSLSVSITDPSLDFDDLQRAILQAGYGYLVCTFSRDATEITLSPSTGLTLDECVSQINECFELAGNILGSVLTEGMTEREKVEALYAYVTENVAYDFRYYNDRDNMPFASTTALGAFRDNLAICGGYSHALEMLLDMAGIENYTVSGSAGGEYHAWNYVVLDGCGYYCDPTYDRGGSTRHLLLTAQELKDSGSYVWEEEFYPKLVK